VENLVYEWQIWLTRNEGKVLAVTQLMQRRVKIQIKSSKANKFQTRMLAVSQKTTTKGNSNMG